MPVMVFFSPNQTKRLYGINLEGETMTLLMRHRGVLLSIVGIALIVSAFKADYRIFAIALAFISKIAFIFLIATSNNYAAELKQVALIDVGALILLLAVLGIHYFGK
jgi:flagellar biosynthesis protein FliQ